MEDRRHQEETDRQLKETDRQLKETDRQLKETDQYIKETARQMKENGERLEKTLNKTINKALGKLGNRFGELIEHLIVPNIVEKFNALGYHFDEVSQNREILRSDGADAEIDALLANEEYSIAIEIKSKPNEDDVLRHIRRMEILREHADKHHDTRKLRGAIAGAIMSKEVRNFALKTGFYVIEQSGDTVEIDVPPNFTPREW
jgi:hypothetical protein